MRVPRRRDGPRWSPFALALFLGCSGGTAGSADEPGTDGAVAPPTTIPGVWFREVAEPAGVVFRRLPTEYDAAPQRFSGGVCLLDADLDGRLDLFFPGDADPRRSGPHLYVARAPLRYEDQTKTRGLGQVGAGGGCVAFDLEGDGDLDLLITGKDTLRLFRNDGGAFVDVTSRLGSPLAPGVFATSAVAFDADGDGDLDLAVGTFGRYVAPPEGTVCFGPCDAQILNYEYSGTILLLQRDDGTFVDHDGPVFRRKEPTLVLLATDLDDDGRVDLFVGNDLGAYHDRYLRRRDDGVWEDVGEALGVAWATRSKSGLSSMSAFDADVDGDGRLDLVESSNDIEPDALFRCAPGGTLGTSCRDVADDLELFRTPRTYRWGQVLVDFDHDGVLELFEGLGHYQYLQEAGGLSPDYKTLDRPLLWHRDDVSSPFAIAPPTLGLSAQTAARGVVAADLDDDGDLDVVVGTAFGRPLLLENVHEKRGRSVQLRLSAHGKNPFAVGARVRVKVGVRTVPFVVHAGSGYASSGDPRLHLGVGNATTVTVDVDWPSGKKTRGLVVPAEGTQPILEP